MAAFLTFFGPDSVSQVRVIDASGTDVARFMIQNEKKGFSISRVMGPGAAPMPICTTTHKSSFSGTLDLEVHSQKVEFKSTTEGFELKTPAGKMKWRHPSGSLSSDKFELRDEGKQVLAKAHTKEMKMEVFVPADEVMLDFWLAGWVALVKKKTGSSEGIQAAAEIMGALGGAGG